MPIQLDVIVQEKNQLELLSLFISEYYTMDRDMLCHMITATPVIKEVSMYKVRNRNITLLVDYRHRSRWRIYSGPGMAGPKEYLFFLYWGIQV